MLNFRIASSIGSYLVGYLSKGERTEQIKGARTVRYSKGFRVANNQFTWIRSKAYRWRACMGKFAELINVKYDQMSGIYGHRWAYRFKTAFEEMGISEAEQICKEIAYELNYKMSCWRLNSYG